MAMGQQPHPMRSAHRGAGIGNVAFTTAGAGPATVTNVVDDGGLIASAIAHPGAGVYTITLTDQFRRVRAAANVRDTTATVWAKVTAITEGNAAINTITVQTESGAAAADTTGMVVDLLIFLG